DENRTTHRPGGARRCRGTPARTGDPGDAASPTDPTGHGGTGLDVGRVPTPHQRATDRGRLAPVVGPRRPPFHPPATGRPAGWRARTDHVAGRARALSELLPAARQERDFALSVPEIEAGAARWDLGRPYFIRQEADGLCTHKIDANVGIRGSRPRAMVFPP